FVYGVPDFSTSLLHLFSSCSSGGYSAGIFSSTGPSIGTSQRGGSPTSGGMLLTIHAWPLKLLSSLYWALSAATATVSYVLRSIVLPRTYPVYNSANGWSPALEPGLSPPCPFLPKVTSSGVSRPWPTTRMT